MDCFHSSHVSLPSFLPFLSPSHLPSFLCSPILLSLPPIFIGPFLFFFHFCFLSFFFQQVFDISMPGTAQNCSETSIKIPKSKNHHWATVSVNVSGIQTAGRPKVTNTRNFISFMQSYISGPFHSYIIRGGLVFWKYILRFFFMPVSCLWWLAYVTYLQNFS